MGAGLQLNVSSLGIRWTARNPADWFVNILAAQRCPFPTWCSIMRRPWLPGSVPQNHRPNPSRCQGWPRSAKPRAVFNAKNTGQPFARFFQVRPNQAASNGIEASLPTLTTCGGGCSRPQGAAVVRSFLPQLTICGTPYLAFACASSAHEMEMISPRNLHPL